MNFVDWLGLGLETFKTVNNLIPMVERPGAGPEKLKLVVETTRAIVGTAVAASGNPPLSEMEGAALEALAGSVTTSIVGFFNDLRVFKSQAPAEPPVPAANVVPFPPGAQR